MQANTQKRLEYIDCAKGAGILLVVIGHHLQDSEGVLHWINSFHMPLFFIVTGYLLARCCKRTPLKEAIRSGAKTMLYPYCTFSVVLVLWWIVMGIALKAQPEEALSSMLLRMLTTYGYHALWFLPTMYIASVVSKTYQYNNHWALLTGSAAMGCILSYMIHSVMLFQGVWRYLAMYVGRVFLAISFIEIGRVLHRYEQKMDNATEWLVFVTSALMSIVLHKENILVSTAFSRIGNPAVFYPAACAGSIAVLLLCKKMAGSFVGRKLSFWGRNSLIVMALHMDISIEIAWIVLSVTHLGSLFSFRTASILAILIEMILLPCMIVIINRYGYFLVRLPEWKEK